MKKRYFSAFGFLLLILALGLAFTVCSLPMGNNEPKAPPPNNTPEAPAKTIEIVVGGSGSIIDTIDALPTAIKIQLGGNLDLPYTVTFASNILKSTLIITPVTFPGTGKVTVKARPGVTLNKGIHITRSNVELNGLMIEITNIAADPTYPNFPVTNVPVYYDGSLADDHRDGNPCALMIGNRYGGYLGNPNKNISYNPAKDPLEYYSISTINNVAIVDCEITFLSNINIKGIVVDPFTTGRTAATRAKITDTKVTINHDDTTTAGWCFFGNNADFSGNTFTTTSSSGVILLDFIFGLTYGGTNDTVSFTGNNIFKNINTKNNTLIAAVSVNEWEDISGTVEGIQYKFGRSDHVYDDLVPKYKQIIIDLLSGFNSIVDKKVVVLMDWYLWNRNPPGYKFGVDTDTVYYRKNNENNKYEVNWSVSGTYVGWH
jgi:hypothetical protein